MSVEQVQKGQASDGRGIVLWVPAIADPSAPKVAELTAAGVKAITYGLASDGLAHETTVATITTGRYMLDQAIELDGTVTDTVEVKWVYNRTAPTVVETTLGTPGLDAFLVKILGYANGTTIAAAMKCNAVIPVTTSIPRDIPSTTNSELMKVQKLNVRGKVYREVAIIS